MGFFNRDSNAPEENQPLSKVGWKQLIHLDQLNELVGESKNRTVFIFKHSKRCGVSRMVLKQFEGEYKPEDDITPYFLDLLAHRGLSDAVAVRFGVRHQSPQLIVVKDGKAVFHDSHGSIDASQLEQFI